MYGEEQPMPSGNVIKCISRMMHNLNLLSCAFGCTELVCLLVALLLPRAHACTFVLVPSDLVWLPLLTETSDAWSEFHAACEEAAEQAAAADKK